MKNFIVIIFTLISVLVFGQKTQLRKEYCGAKNTTTLYYIWAQKVEGAEGYRFKIENADLGYSEIIETKDEKFKLSHLKNPVLDQKTYNISVSVKMGDTYGEYGEACNVHVYNPRPADGKFSELIERFSPSGYIKFKAKSLIQGEIIYKYKSEIVSDENVDFSIVKEWEDKSTKTGHTTYQQTYNGIPIEGANFIEHSKGGYVTYIDGSFVSGLKWELGDREIPAANDVLKEFISSMPGYLFAWEDPNWEEAARYEASIQEDGENVRDTYYPEGKLVWVLRDKSTLGYKIPAENYSLAYEFNITCVKPKFHKTFYVDPFTKAIIKEESHEKAIDGTADLGAIDNNRGVQTIVIKDKALIGKNYILKANDDDRRIHTRAADGGTASNSNWRSLNDYENGNDVDWDTDDQEGTNAHWCVTQAWDYFATVWNHHGPSGNSKPRDRVRVRANANSGAGTANEKNPKYDHDDGVDRHYITAGFINGVYSGTMLDVMGHEFGHALTHEFDIGGSGEVGAIEEGFCDIFGVLVERRYGSNPNQNVANTDWIIGNQVDLSGNEFYRYRQRNLADPSSSNWSRHNPNSTVPQGQPDTYGMQDDDDNGTPWNWNKDESDPHINCGVMNRWFYLLAAGGSGTNGVYDDYDVLDGVGIDVASYIAFHTLKSGGSSSLTFQQLREKAIEVAEDKYGVDSREAILTQNAWYAVGVGDEYVYQKLNANFNPEGNEVAPKVWLVCSSNDQGSLDHPYTIILSNTGTATKYYIEILEVPRVWTSSDQPWNQAGSFSKWFSGNPPSTIELDNIFFLKPDKLYRVKLALQNNVQSWVEEVRYISKGKNSKPVVYVPDCFSETRVPGFKVLNGNPVVTYEWIYNKFDNTGYTTLGQEYLEQDFWNYHDMNNGGNKYYIIIQAVATGSHCHQTISSSDRQFVTLNPDFETKTNCPQLPAQERIRRPIISERIPVFELIQEVYPNPTLSGKFNVVLSDEVKGSKPDLEVINGQGTTVKRMENIDKNTQIDLSDQPRGSYMIRVISETSVSSEKVLYQ